MFLKEILEKKPANVWSVKGDQPLSEAVGLLVKNNIGAVLVLDDKESIAGILSERDVMGICDNAPDTWMSKKVQDVMTSNVLVCKLDDTTDHAMGIMTNNRIRHIPVMDGERVAGVISIGDVVKACLQDSQYENTYLKEYLSGS